MDVEIKNSFISFLIESKVLIFGDFVTKSGRNTPYFINTGNFKSGKQIYILGEFYANLIVDSGCKYDVIFGPAYKGIPILISCCISLYNKYGISKPFFFNRKEEKKHGDKGRFVGETPKDKNTVIVVEDILTAGTSVNEFVPLLKSHYDIVLKDMFVLVDRCEKGKNSNKSAKKEIKDTFNINIHSIITIKDLFKYLNSSKEFEKEAKKMESYIDSFCIF